MTIRPRKQWKFVRLGILVLCVFASIMVLYQAGFTQETTTESSDTKIISGVLKEFNAEENRGRLVTDLGEPVFLDIPEPGLFSTISVGQHITVQVDLEGKVTKAIETPIPELRHPLP